MTGELYQVRHGILCERVSVARGRFNSDCGRKCGNHCKRGVEANFMKGFHKNVSFQALWSIFVIMLCIKNIKCHAKWFKNWIHFVEASKLPIFACGRNKENSMSAFVDEFLKNISSTQISTRGGKSGDHGDHGPAIYFPVFRKFFGCTCEKLKNLRKWIWLQIILFTNRAISLFL